MGFGAALPWGVASAASRTWVTASEVLQKASRSRLTRWGNIEYGPHGLPHGLKTPHWLFFFGWWIVMDECVNPRLPGFGSFLNLFRWYPPIIDSVKNYDVKETYRNTRFRRDSHFPLKQPDSGWNSNPSSGQIIHGICKPSTNVAMLPGAWKGFATRYCRAELGRLVYMCFWVAWWPVEKQKEGSLRQNLPKWNSIGGIRPYCFLVKISPFKTWLLEVITAMGRGLHWPLAVLSLEQVRHCKSGNKHWRRHGAMALSLVSSLLNMASWFMMLTSCYISFSLIFWRIVSNTDAAMMLFCCLEALKANLARVRSYRAAIVGGSQNVWPVSMGADGFWPEAAVTSAGWPMALWQLGCGEKSAVHVVLVNSLWRKKNHMEKKQESRHFVFT